MHSAPEDSAQSILDGTGKSDKQMLLEALLRERKNTGTDPMMHYAQWNFLPTWTNDHARKIAAIKALMEDGTIIDIVRPGVVLLRRGLHLDEYLANNKESRI